MAVYLVLNDQGVSWEDESGNKLTRGGTRVRFLVDDLAVGTSTHVTPTATAVVAALPVAAAAYRGRRLRTEGGAGVADAEYICLKNDADAYAWVSVTA